MPKPMRELAERATAGRLEVTLREWRDEGLSYGAIARRLFGEFEIEVSHETIRNWVVSAQDSGCLPNHDGVSHEIPMNRSSSDAISG